MVVMAGPKRSDNCQVVSAFTDMFEPISNRQTAFTVPLITRLQWHQQFALVMTRIQTNQLPIDPFLVVKLFIRCVIDRLPSVFIQFRLDVKTLEMTHSATEENPDDALGPLHQMGTRLRSTSQSLLCRKPPHAVAK